MKFKRVIGIGLAVLACSTMMVGCSGDSEGGGNEGGGTINPGASQTLNIGYFNGGVTVEWLREIAEEYCKLHPDVGIYINSELKDEIKNQKLLADIKNRTEDMYFTHTITYDEFVDRGLFADITDVVKSPAASGEKTVEERMNANLKNYYNANGKYYAVPFYTNFSGAVYDVDLFEEKSLYIAQGGGYTSGLSGQKQKSVGKDGQAGTYDDGLPATFAEYKTWIKYLSKTKNIIPYIWCTDDSYRMSYLNSLWIGYEGMNDYSLNTTFSGTMKNGTEITVENAYLLRNGLGRKFAVEMAKEIISNQYYHPNSVNGSITHTEAQNTFLRGRPDNKPIAMILEGGWWENEARSTFKSLESRGAQYAYGTRRFAYMPVPKYDNNAESGETFFCTSGNIATAINANTKKLELAKDFLKFTLTEHAMSTFTKNIGLSRPYSYDLEDGVYDKLTPFGKNFWDLVTSENSKIYYPTTSNAFRKFTQYFGVYEWEFGASLNGTTYVDPYVYFLNNKDVTAAQYMDGLYAHYTAEGYTAEYNHWKGQQNK